MEPGHEDRVLSSTTAEGACITPTPCCTTARCANGIGTTRLRANESEPANSLSIPLYLLSSVLDGRCADRLAFRQVCEGANHTIFAVGTFEFPVPRHNEINEYTAEAIMKDLADALGEEWWRP